MRDLWGNELDVSMSAVRAQAQGVGCRSRALNLFAGLSFIPRTPSVYWLMSHDETMVKIGKATNPRTRIRDIRAMNPHELTVALAVPGYTRVEGVFHSMLSRHRAHREWFHFEGLVVETLARLRAGDVATKAVFARHSEADLRSCAACEANGSRARMDP